MKNNLFFCLISLFLFFLAFIQVFPASHVFAQATPTPEFGMGVAEVVEILDEEVENGNIISFSEGGYTLSKRAYDPTVYGIITTNPAITLEVIPPDEESVHFVLNSGKAEVLVSSSNGNITTGDLVTASDVPGIGMKSTNDGYIVGTALEDYVNDNPEETGLIMVSLDFAFNANVSGLRSNLLENLDLALQAPFLTPTSALRYIFAGLILLIAFAVGIGYFGRTTQAGVEALGRNPLASRAIIVSVIMNMVLALVTIAAGIGVGYLILTL